VHEGKLSADADRHRLGAEMGVAVNMTETALSETMGLDIANHETAATGDFDRTE
jgi:hypothetical protein